MWQDLIESFIVPKPGFKTLLQGLNVEVSQNELLAPLSWAQRLKRVFNIDITLCPLCGGTMRIISDITDPDLIQKILDHLAAQPPPD